MGLFVNFKKVLVRSILVLLLVSLLVGAILAYLGISTSLHAENTLHAILRTANQVDQFVANERRWPNSWEELEPYWTNDSQVKTWTEESSFRKEHIAIDFDTDLSELATQREEDFAAIYPTGAYYPYWDYGQIKKLILTARKVAAEKEHKP